MPDTFTDVLNMTKPADGDESWGANIRLALDAMDALLKPNNSYWVSPQFSIANLYPGGIGSADRRHFDTIQGAITAGESSDAHTTVFVYPDNYGESLSFTKSCGIVGLTPTKGRSMAGANRVGIYGQGTTSTISFAPTATEYHGISFTNIELGHSYSSTLGALQTWPMILSVSDQGAGNYGAFHNTISMANCYLRKDSLPDEFSSCFWTNGFNKLHIDDCDLRFPSGVNNFEFPIWINGNDAQAKEAVIHVRDTKFNHFSNDDQTIYMNHRSSGLYLRSDSVRARADIITFGPTGVNTCAGLNDDTDFANYGNLSGITPAGI